MHFWRGIKLHPGFLIVSLLIVIVGLYASRWVVLSSTLLLYGLLGAAYALLQKESLRRKQQLLIDQHTAHIQREENARLADIISTQRDIAMAHKDLQTTMQTITERTQELTQAEGGVVELIEGDEMVYRAASGSVLPHLGLRLKAATSLSGRSVRENAIFKCDDAETDERVDREACRKVGVRSMVVVPLRTTGRAIGVLKVMSGKANAFTEQDVATLELMAGVLSASLNDAAAAQALRDSQQRLEEAQQLAHIGSWEFDLATRKITWSKEMFRLMGISSERGEPDYTANLGFYTSESAAALEKCVQKAIYQGKGYEIDLEKISLPGEKPRWYQAVGKPIEDSHGKVVRLVGTLLDITERKKYAADMKAANEWLVDANGLLEAQLLRIREQSIELEAQKAALEASNARFETLAATDGLTGLKNRRALEERLVEEFQRSQRHSGPLSILLLDVDHFKAFNDKFGHPEGDTVLVQVAAILQEVARSSDVAARYGGEEFVLVLPETDALGALKIAERLRNAIAEAVWPHRAITASIGAATTSLAVTSVQALIDLADKALYHSKDQGRNRVSHANASTSTAPAEEANSFLASHAAPETAAVSGVLLCPQRNWNPLETPIEIQSIPA